MLSLKVIMIGDVVGEPGLRILEEKLPGFIRDNAVDFTVVNGENSAAGFGMTRETLNRILAAGADVVTGGNHVWEKREFWPVLDAEVRVLRPANYPGGSPGRGWARFDKILPGGGVQPFIVVNLQGRELMPPIDCPFKVFDAIESSQEDLVTRIVPVPAPEGELPETVKDKAVVLVDFHAESSREKEALAFYLDGRVSVTAGTHTHVQTADERILPGGTAYITDLGMTGVTGGVIGMDPKICLDRARNQVLYRMEVAAAGTGGEAIQGIIVEINSGTRKAVSVKRLA
jgi:metallophosphoesterase (TIGR00282 family)